jgi:hypothetical protein
VLTFSGIAELANHLELFERDPHVIRLGTSKERDSPIIDHDHIMRRRGAMPLDGVIRLALTNDHGNWKFRSDLNVTKQGIRDCDPTRRQELIGLLNLRILWRI